MSTREEILEKFHKAFGIAIDESPTIELLRLRQTLIREEAEELFQEMDTAITLLEQGKEVP